MCIYGGILGHKVAYDHQRLIVFIFDAEKYFEVGILLEEGRF